jgi:gliding motility-associated lipoprotein GldD
MMNRTILILLAGAFVLLQACNSNYTYKKKGYFRVDLPEKQYRLFDQPGYPYSFEYPVYANISRDSTFFGETTENPWWINIDIPQLAGRIYVSYKEIGGKNKFDSLVDDGFKMAYKQHTDVSTGINESRIQTPNGIGGIYFSLRGNTATANQFFLTDTTKHFLRGALYFDATPNEDSLSVVNEYLKKDLDHLINTLKWK